MNVTISGYVISLGTPAGEPCRLIDAKGSRKVDVRDYIDSDSPGIYDLKNAVIDDVLEAEYEVESPTFAFKKYADIRNAVLSKAAGALIYDGVTVAMNALVREVTLAGWTGVSVTIRYSIVGVRA
jgi:hypothetical protein